MALKKRDYCVEAVQVPDRFGMRHVVMFYLCSLSFGLNPGPPSPSLPPGTSVRCALTKYFVCVMYNTLRRDMCSLYHELCEAFESFWSLASDTRPLASASSRSRPSRRLAPLAVGLRSLQSAWPDPRLPSLKPEGQKRTQKNVTLGGGVTGAGEGSPQLRKRAMVQHKQDVHHANLWFCVAGGEHLTYA